MPLKKDVLQANSTHQATPFEIDVYKQKISIDMLCIQGTIYFYFDYDPLGYTSKGLRVMQLHTVDYRC